MKKPLMTEYQAKTEALHLAAIACEKTNLAKYPSNERMLINVALFDIALDLEKKAREREDTQND